MQRFRILGVALMAMFALSAVMSATASAEVKILPTLTVEEKWTGESGKGTLEVLGGEGIECTKDKSEGTFEANKPLGKFHIHLEGCKTAGGITCTGLSEKTGIILALGTFHLVWNKLGAELGAGALFLVELTHFVCLFVLVEVEGEVLCLIKPVGAKVKHFEVVCKPAALAGDPGETTYWNEGGTEVKMGEEKLLTHESDGAGVMSSENTTALILTIVNREIMS
jgi:hypothetical protein